MGLPKAHVQAPTILSIILARLSLKVRLVILSFLLTSLNLSSTLLNVTIFCLIIRIYVSCITRALSLDTKVFLAYCSVSHITIRYVRLFSYVVWRFIRAWIIRLGHCLSSPLMFYLAGNMQYATHSRISFYTDRFTFSSRIFILKRIIYFKYPIQQLHVLQGLNCSLSYSATLKLRTILRSNSKSLLF